MQDARGQEVYRWDIFRAGRFWFTTSMEANVFSIREACGFLTSAEGVTVTALVAEEVAA